MGRLDRERFSRHIQLHSFGEKGQQKLLNASVLVVGAGGLGSSAIMYLTAAGVGTIGICDGDVVELSNLQRQVIHSLSSVGTLKTDSAAEWIQKFSPQTIIKKFPFRVTAVQVMETIRSFDIILDATDNFQTRYLLNAACVKMGKPLIYAAIHEYEGQFSVFSSHQGPCYRCFYPNFPKESLFPDCNITGVLGVLPGLLGIYQATEAIKMITGIGQVSIGKLHLLNLLSHQMDIIDIGKNPTCPVCSVWPDAIEISDEIGSTCLPDEWHIRPEEVLQFMKNNRDGILVDIREEHELVTGMIPGAVHMPLSKKQFFPWSDYKKGKIVLYCQTGKRSDSFAMELKQVGMPFVYHLKGGFSAWKFKG